MTSLRLSASLSELDKLACRIPASPYYFSTTILDLLPNHTASLHPSVAALYSQLALAKRQIFLLESQTAFLREEVNSLRFTIKFLLAEIAVLQPALEYAKDGKGTSRLARADRERIISLEKQLADYQRFVRTLAEGRVLDPGIINPAQARLEHGREPESALVEAIQDASRDEDSPWSKILPALIESGISSKYLATANLALEARKDPHDMERLAHCRKIQAISTPSRRASTISSQTKVIEVTNVSVARNPQPQLPNCGVPDIPAHDESNNDNICTPEPPSSYTTSPPLLIPVSSEHLEKASLPDVESVRRACSGLRPSHSDGSQTSTNQASTRNKVYCKYTRRITFHDSTNLDAQVAEKRHGFIMPCIKSVLNKHASAPVKNCSSSDDFSPNRGADSVGLITPTFPPRRSNYHSSGSTLIQEDPDAIRRVSLRTAQVLQSAERLCATFSSGSLGSLEASILSSSSRTADSSVDDCQPLKNLSITDNLTLVKFPESATLDRDQNTVTKVTEEIESTVDTKRGSGYKSASSYYPGDKAMAPDLTVTTPTPSRPHKVSTEAPASVTAKSTKKQESTLPLVRAATPRVSRPLMNQTAQRTVRICRSTVSAYSPKVSKNLASESRPTPVTAPVRIQRAKTLGCMSDAQGLVIGAPHPSATQLLAASTAFVNSTCAPKPTLRLNFALKSALAKSVPPVKSVNVTNRICIPTLRPCLQKRLELPTMATVAPQALPDASATETPCHDRVQELPTSTSNERVLMPKPRSRLRVVNNSTQPTLKKPARLPLLPTQQSHNSMTLLQIPSPSPLGIQDRNHGTRLVSRERTNRGEALGSKSGAMGGVGKASSHKAHSVTKTVKLESRGRDKRP